MKNKKLSGSFYTPKIIADFFVDYLSDKLTNKPSISILEPSAGDGVFIQSVFNHSQISKKIKELVVVEKKKTELKKIDSIIKDSRVKTFCVDFLEFQKEKRKKFSLCLGNPPYIKKNYLTKKQETLCEEIHSEAGLSENKIKNIWTAFLVRCIKFVDKDGVLAFVLPAELLQVKYASELRNLILKEFERVEIFTFNELLFEKSNAKGQDTLLLIAERKSLNGGVYYCNIDKQSDLAKRKFTLAQNIKIKESKWTHHHLDTEEIELLEKIKDKLQTVNDYCSSKAGIVTAANDYFIVDENTVEKYSLQNFIKPIIQKATLVNGSVILTEEEFQLLIDKSKPTNLLALDKDSEIRKNAKLWSYLKIGKDKQIHKRYKTSIRNNWYEVPNIGNPAEAFFFKRCNLYPKLIKNSANVLVTDSAYTISMKDGFEIENLIFSFYNSVTLAFAELYGRYYGGGVLELMPNEFKSLPVPYISVTAEKFNSYVADFKSKSSIKDVCKLYDKSILKSIDRQLDDDSISKLYRIREKLYLRRIKSN